MKAYALWNIKKKAFWSSGHGCSSGIHIVTFNTKTEAEQFLKRSECEDMYKIKGVSVGG